MGIDRVNPRPARTAPLLRLLLLLLLLSGSTTLLAGHLIVAIVSAGPFALLTTRTSRPSYCPATA
eukprot:COSAG06_NODE_64474_length_259_cov_0.962500_1_plen_64_part_10